MWFQSRGYLSSGIVEIDEPHVYTCCRFRDEVECLRGRTLGARVLQAPLSTDSSPLATSISVTFPLFAHFLHFPLQARSHLFRTCAVRSLLSFVAEYLNTDWHTYLRIRLKLAVALAGPSRIQDHIRCLTTTFLGIPCDLWLVPSLCVRKACRACARLLLLSHPIVWVEVACRSPSAALAMVVETGLVATYSLLDTMASWLVLLFQLYFGTTTPSLGPLCSGGGLPVSMSNDVGCSFSCQGSQFSCVMRYVENPIMSVPCPYIFVVVLPQIWSSLSLLSLVCKTMRVVFFYIIRPLLAGEFGRYPDTIIAFCI